MLWQAGEADRRVQAAEIEQAHAQELAAAMHKEMSEAEQAQKRAQVEVMEAEYSASQAERLEAAAAEAGEAAQNAERKLRSLEAALQATAKEMREGGQSRVAQSVLRAKKAALRGEVEQARAVVTVHSAELTAAQQAANMARKEAERERTEAEAALQKSRLEREEADVAVRMLEAIEDLKNARREMEPHERAMKSTVDELLRGSVIVDPDSVMAESHLSTDRDITNDDSEDWLAAIERLFLKHATSKTMRLDSSEISTVFDKFCYNEAQQVAAQMCTNLTQVGRTLMAGGYHHQCPAVLQRVVTHVKAAFGEESSEYASVLHCLAHALRVVGQYSEAVELLQVAFHIRKADGDQHGMARVLHSQSIVLMQQATQWQDSQQEDGKKELAKHDEQKTLMDVAIRCISLEERALKIAQGLNDEALESDIRDFMGRLLSMSKDYPQAMEHSCAAWRFRSQSETHQTEITKLCLRNNSGQSPADAEAKELSESELRAMLDVLRICLQRAQWYHAIKIVETALTQIDAGVENSRLHCRLLVALGCARAEAARARQQHPHDFADYYKSCFAARQTQTHLLESSMGILATGDWLPSVQGAFDTMIKAHKMGEKGWISQSREVASISLVLLRAAEIELCDDPSCVVGSRHYEDVSQLAIKHAQMVLLTTRRICGELYQQGVDACSKRTEEIKEELIEQEKQSAFAESLAQSRAGSFKTR